MKMDLLIDGAAGRSCGQGRVESSCQDGVLGQLSESVDMSGMMNL